VAARVKSPSHHNQIRTQRAAEDAARCSCALKNRAADGVMPTYEMSTRLAPDVDSHVRGVSAVDSSTFALSPPDRRRIPAAPQPSRI
jgi:hypothetical protein